MLTSLRGVYRNGRIVFHRPPKNIREETPVIVTFIESSTVDLRERGVSKKQAKSIRAQLAPFAEEWESPEMSAYDNYEAIKAKT
jgi:hypothetical protein